MPNIPLTTSSLTKIPKEIFLVGGVSREGSTDWGALDDTFVAKRVPDSKKHVIAENNIWTTGRTWNPYISFNSYDIAFNSENNIVYLCLHNNSNFRDDTNNVTVGLSTQAPSHAFGRQTYSDGYTWLPLWKVDFTEYDYINETDLPIPNLDTTADYSSFTEKYQPLCGTGVTAYGCCCLYFKDNSVDEVTGEVYSVGDVTNEVIFSDCFECQKLADALDRDVLFLSGVTSGGITSSHPGENPLCPATKTIQTLQDKLQADVYNLVPGSSKEYQLQLLNNHNHLGIMAVSIDLSDLTDTQKTISTSTQNPYVTVNDPTGSGAVVRLKTNPVGIDKQLIYGIELVEEGSGYGLIPSVSSSLLSTTLINRITVHPYPEDVYTNPELYTHPVKYRLLGSLTNSDLVNVVPYSVSLERVAVMTDPYFYSSQAPAQFTRNDSSVVQMTTQILIYKPGTEVVAVGFGGDESEYATANDHVLTPKGYEANIISATSDQSGYVLISPSVKAKGYNLVSNDDPATFKVGDSIIYRTTTGTTDTFKVKTVTPPLLDPRTASFFNITDIDPIGVTSSSKLITTKSYEFDIQINV